VQLLKKWCDVVVPTPREDKSCSSVKDGLQSAQLVAWEAGECRIAKVESLQNQRHHHGQHHLPRNRLTYTAELTECSKAIRHGLRNISSKVTNCRFS